jgi:hypothetical protein
MSNKIYDDFITLDMAHTREEIEKYSDHKPILTILINLRIDVQNKIDPSKLTDKFIEDTEYLIKKYL